MVREKSQKSQDVVLASLAISERKCDETESVSESERCSRPRAAISRNDRKLRKIVKNFRGATSREINQQRAQNVSDRIIKNRLNEMGFSFQKAKTKQLITEKHKRERAQ